MTPAKTSDHDHPATLPPPLWRQSLRALWPAPMAIDARERWRAVAGAALGILLTAWLGHWLAPRLGLSFANGGNALWLVPPMGASAVLVFCVPASPLAQPWPVVAGNTVSALVGIACARWIGDPMLAAALAVSVAIGAMMALRCLHPPGGAMALSAVLGHAVGLEFAEVGALLNSTFLVAAGMAYNHATGRRYPHVAARAPAAVDDVGPHFTAADLDAALAQHNEILDISRDDLESLLRQTELAAYRRNLGALTCADVMSSPPLSVAYGTLLQDAWNLLRRHRIKALPVVDRAQRIVGIVTQADFLRHAAVDRPQELGPRLREFVRRTGAVATEKPEVVGQIMARQVRVASAGRPLTELVPLFSEGGHHHIPIIDREAKLVGVITQSDLVRALYRAVRSGDDAPRRERDGAAGV